MTVFFFSLSVSFFLVAFFFHIRGCNITGFGLTIKIAMLASKLLIVASPLFDHYYEHQKMSQITFVHFSLSKSQVPLVLSSSVFFFVKNACDITGLVLTIKKKSKAS